MVFFRCLVGPSTGQSVNCSTGQSVNRAARSRMDSKLTILIYVEVSAFASLLGERIVSASLVGDFVT
ncbi:hypothetical protein CFREI_11280 [Corynebacterium freiburgense]|nr:hypothetical protein CFREI_11280 [Corynebacterium freiburgense]